MKTIKRFIAKITLGITVFVSLSSGAVFARDTINEKPFGIVIHGGAGFLEKIKIPEEKENRYRQKLEEALNAGYKILEAGGKSIDAVEAAIRIMEDSPLFNAGKGAVFAADGKNHCDASVMEGKTLNAGAVADVIHIKNPISLARLVMERSPHVMLTGTGAEMFAKEMGIPLVPNTYFYTKERWDGLLKAKKDEMKKIKEKSNKAGTVGAVALDKDGDLAAGTSTGGMVNKKYGRVGDSPIIGAGTYANNRTCAVSSTGYGEFFIRAVVAYDISALMEYSGFTLEQAAGKVMEKLEKLGGYGGVIAIDQNGNIATPFTTSGMFRAYKKNDGKMVIGIFKDDRLTEKK